MSTVGGGVNIVRNGLVLYLDAANTKSYVSGSTTWNDVSRGGNNGTLTNGPGYDSANGGSIVFDGVNDYVELGNVLNMGTNSLTITQWINLNSLSGSTSLSKSRAAAQNYRFSVGLVITARLGAFIQGNGGADIIPYGSTVLTTGQWFMATFIFNRASTIQIYYNTNLETLTGSATISQWNNLDFQSTNPFRIGTYTNADNTGISSLISGKIGQTIMYNRVLSSDEVLQNYNATRTRFGL